MPTERDRHRPAPRRYDRCVNTEFVVTRDRGDHDAMPKWKRRRINDRGRTHAGGVGPHPQLLHRPVRPTDEQPMNRQPVAVDA
jgi:hypothetical protein